MSALSELLNSQPVSARQAADRAVELGIRLPYGTIAAYWSGGHGKPSAATLDKLAQVLPTVTITQLREAAWNAVAAELGDYHPPSDARFLDRRQRQAVDELIRSIVATRGATHADRTDRTDPQATTEDAQGTEGEEQKTYGFDAGRVTPLSDHPDRDTLRAMTEDIRRLEPEEASMYVALFQDAKQAQLDLDLATTEFSAAVDDSDDARIGNALDVMSTRLGLLLSTIDALNLRILDRADSAQEQEIAGLASLRNGAQYDLLDLLRRYIPEIILPGIPDGHLIGQRFQAQLTRIENSIELEVQWRQAIERREEQLAKQAQVHNLDDRRRKPAVLPKASANRNHPKGSDDAGLDEGEE